MVNAFNFLYWSVKNNSTGLCFKKAEGELCQDVLRYNKYVSYTMRPICELSHILYPIYLDKNFLWIQKQKNR